MPRDIKVDLADLNVFPDVADARPDDTPNTARADSQNKRVHVALCHRSYDVTEDERNDRNDCLLGKQKRKKRL